jgi:hypothetical protein
MTKLAYLALVLAPLVACSKKTETRSEATGSAAVAAQPADAAVDAVKAWDGKEPLTLGDFATPESVLHDPDADVYLVSNINGDPLGADDNGFISRVSPEGKVLEHRWIDGARDDVKLDAPKGMAIVDGILYVSDITVIRKFDAKTGEPKGDIAIKGATFLNDVAPAPGGGVYVTDSGLNAKFEPTGTDAVHHLGKDGKVKTLAANKKLAGPNGVVAGDKGAVWVVTFGSGEIYAVDAKGKQSGNQKLPSGQLDGIVQIASSGSAGPRTTPAESSKVDAGGDLLVSSWEGSAIYRGTPGGEWKPVVENVKSPADIGWDATRRRILIPVFLENNVILHPLP